jgi:hypothetical protein
LTVADLASVEATPTYRTTVAKDVKSETIPDVTKLIVAGKPDQSGVLKRIEAARGQKLSMPPLATELSDPDTAAAVRAWISEL